MKIKVPNLTEKNPNKGYYIIVIQYFYCKKTQEIITKVIHSRNDNYILISIFLISSFYFLVFFKYIHISLQSSEYLVFKFISLLLFVLFILKKCLYYYISSSVGIFYIHSIIITNYEHNA